jgi:phosphatidylglycerophosphate synthase
MTILSEGLVNQVWRRRVPNLITLSRVVLTCFVNYYILTYFGKIAIPLSIFGLILFTDYVDGKIARLYGTVSPGGAVFDLLADFFFMLLSYLVLHSFRIIPFWFVCVLCGKFAEFILTSFFLKKSGIGRDNQVFLFDFLGRFVAAVLYLFPVLLYSSYQLAPAIYTFCINKLTYIILFFTLLSSVYRIGKYFRRQR